MKIYRSIELQEGPPPAPRYLLRSMTRGNAGLYRHVPRRMKDRPLALPSSFWNIGALVAVLAIIGLSEARSLATTILGVTMNFNRPT